MAVCVEQRKCNIQVDFASSAVEHYCRNKHVVSQTIGALRE